MCLLLKLQSIVLFEEVILTENNWTNAWSGKMRKAIGNVCIHVANFQRPKRLLLHGDSGLSTVVAGALHVCFWWLLFHLLHSFILFDGFNRLINFIVSISFVHFICFCESIPIVRLRSSFLLRFCCSSLLLSFGLQLWLHCVVAVALLQEVAGLLLGC